MCFYVLPTITDCRQHLGIEASQPVDIAKKGDDKENVSLFFEMHKEGPGFNQTTLSTVLKSIAFLQIKDMGKQVHALSVKSGFEFDSYVINSLIDAYGKCSLVEDAARILDTSRPNSFSGHTLSP
ncbi:hypothetical protein IFM89_012138 [Coptis chinensis]|uniref:Pentatricopeptide repeat-containing protein n=1 Tax=Coptis chinensis TaxID=261450 RepID=A0A835I1V0_9MAGN|nr:hypothetical protein IFM89_012138 [Coptis chinensis]